MNLPGAEETCLLLSNITSNTQHFVVCEERLGRKWGEGHAAPRKDSTEEHGLPRKTTDYIKAHGHGRWRSLPKNSGLKRCGKSCRLRWLNYLRPDIKRGNISPDEEELIVRLHKLLGNRWSLIAGRLPGRTDNEIKSYWNTNLGRRQQNNNPAPDDKRTKMSLDAAKSSPMRSKPMNGAEPMVTRTNGLSHSNQVVLNIPQPKKQDRPNSDQTSTSMPNKAEHSNGSFSTMTNNSDESRNLFMGDDSVLDFNLGDLCLSDLLSCTDFSKPLAHPLDHQHQPTAEIMLYEEPGAADTQVDMHPFATFIDYNEDDQWLG